MRERPKIAAHPLRAATAALGAWARGKHSWRIEQGSTGVTFEVVIASRDVPLQSWLDEPGGTRRGAYFVDVDFPGGE